MLALWMLWAAPTVHLHVDSPAPVGLYEYALVEPVGISWPSDAKLVCHSPCDADLAVEGRSFFFGGPGLPASPSFRFPSSTPAWARVQPGSATLSALGYGLGGVGLVGLGAAAVALTSREVGTVGGTAAIVLGAAFLAVGALLVLEARTRYEFLPAPAG